MVFFIVNFRAKGFCSRIKDKDATPSTFDLKKESQHI